MTPAKQTLHNTNDRLEDVYRELHHRVSNNLQHISSLLFLKQDELKQPEAKGALLAVRDRVLAMGEIHGLLLRQSHQLEIDLKQYLHQLVLKIIELNASPMQEVAAIVHISDFNHRIDTDKALLMGLIINEVITNSYKYAFKGNTAPKLTFSAQMIAENRLQIDIGDNGKGISKNAERPGSGSFGLHLIDMFCHKERWEVQKASNQGGTNYYFVINP